MIDLFVLSDCMYCRKVINFLQEHNIKCNIINIENNEKAEELIKIGGKEQVPFLLDKENNIEMYESDNIIEYLKTLL